MTELKSKRFTDRLPATPCTSHMREQMISLSESTGLKLSELQRIAIQIFLDQNAKFLDISIQKVEHQ
jgi:hypothetical protein